MPYHLPNVEEDIGEHSLSFTQEPLRSTLHVLTWLAVSTHLQNVGLKVENRHI